MENLKPGCAIDSEWPGGEGSPVSFPGYPGYREESQDEEETPVSSERNHDEVWEEDIELPERKESKQIPNPWE